MSNPKLHHYVPQFYLRRFTDPSGRIWAWDKIFDRAFHTNPRSVAKASALHAAATSGGGSGCGLPPGPEPPPEGS
ncbi:DUF4238 domain-containing protein [Thermobifida cellulosilytica]|uniref:DUF4238 domain-containing protein n=1 Tax=Thermobifida cellulosilytica TaxID=144786 RepID=UPI000A000DB7